MKNLLYTMLIIFFSVNNITAQWIDYITQDSCFRIQFPGQPQVMNLKSGYGIDSTQIYSYSDTQGNYYYSLTVFHVSKERFHPESNEEKRFELLKGLATASIGLVGNILSTEKITLQGYPGIFVTGETTQGIKEPYPPVFVKSYLVENRIYQLMVPCSHENKENKEKDIFFNSFELTLKK